MPTAYGAVAKTVICAFLICLPACASLHAADKPLGAWGGGARGWEGWTSTEEGWRTTDFARDHNPYPAVPHVESSEMGAGTFRSPVFVVKGDILRFWVNGWDGKSGGRGANQFLLRRRADGFVLRRAAPPQRDPFEPITWVVSDLKGKEVRFEAVDGIKDGGFAWLGIAKIEEIRRDVSAQKSPYRALSLAPSFGTWSILRYDGARRPTSPYLSSLGAGEPGTGVIRSPVFTVSTHQIRLVLRGHDGEKGGRGENRVELVAAETGDVVRFTAPPQDDGAAPVVWDVTDLEGKKVFIRLIDSNAGSAFAWMGIDEVDAGPALRVKFASEAALKGWSAQQAEGVFAEWGGVPFVARSGSVVPEGGTYLLKLGFKAKRLFLLGMTNSLDVGCPVWGDPRDLASRFFLGDRLGTFRLRYADGKVEEYPLTLGENLWWGKRFADFQEPFKSSARARAVLADSLRLYPPKPAEDGRYLAVIAPRPVRLVSMEVEDSKGKNGVPVIAGMTIEAAAGEKVPGSVSLPHSRLSPELAAFIRSKALRPKGRDEAAAATKLENLKRTIYVSPADFRAPIKIEMPAGYKGPRVRFKGTAYADVLTNVFHHNVQDICDKVDSEGMYHTSTKGAPSWGSYEGFGTYTQEYGAYYAHSWSRDLGRSLQELTECGYLDEARRCAEYCFRMARLWEQKPDELKYKGQALPPHWCRIINLPNPTEGNFENDGHGLISLFVHKLWQRMPDRDVWLRVFWDDVRAAGDWVVWQLDNPQVSGATEVLLTDSECSAGVGRSVYADYACMEGLRGLAEMAQSIGENDSAQNWLKAADRLQNGIRSTYIVEDKKYGRTWTLAESGWPNHSTVTAPIILAADRRGFEPEADDFGWRDVSTATYQRLIDNYKPFGFYGVAMGYGQGFVTESALLLDRMSEATTMLNWIAKCTYDPRHKPWIVPEGCEVEPGGRFWHRTGDLGNGVQEGEVVKTLRIVVGIDDTDPARLLIYPRLPNGWTEVSVESYPALIGRDTAKLRYRLTRNGKSLELSVFSDRPLGRVDVRLGPFAAKADCDTVLLNGEPTTAEVIRSGDSWWARTAVPAGSTTFSVSARQAGGPSGSSLVPAGRA